MVLTRSQSNAELEEEYAILAHSTYASHLIDELSWVVASNRTNIFVAPSHAFGAILSFE